MVLQTIALDYSNGMYIYIHVPFCRSRCIYCDFYVVLEKYGGQDAYVGALLREVDQRFSASDNFLSPVKTIYVGGGTPSLLSASAYQQLFGRIQEYVPIVDNAEITLEANPQAMADDPAAYLDAGFNRLSVGVQSFNDQELKRLSRIHTAAEAEQFIQEMRRAGFSTISLDLMYGLPGQTLQSWLDVRLESGREYAACPAQQIRPLSASR
jgi:oxygen-independent coproporphyrinogen III oxidase